MAKKLKGLQLLVGNRLDDGRAVFFSQSQGWVTDVSAATGAEGDDLTNLIEKAKDSVNAQIIAGFEPVEAVVTEDGIQPVHGKPLMQAKGPSVRLDLGYQTGLKWEAS